MNFNLSISKSDRMDSILNDQLPWDGSHLGEYPMEIVAHKWLLEKVVYYGLKIEKGTIYCNAVRRRNLFPCIVEGIKEIFGIVKRGVHQIKIGKIEYLIYYVPVSTRGEIIWETPLNRLDSKHHLRSDPQFQWEVRKIIAFCDILALGNTNEGTVRIRPGVNHSLVPFNINESTTTISKSVGYDFTVIRRPFFNKWFGEKISVEAVVRQMIDKPDELSALTIRYRELIDQVINKFDTKYIWYSYFITERLSRFLLQGAEEI